jgi:hypothetical protein
MERLLGKSSRSYKDCLQQRHLYLSFTVSSKRFHHLQRPLLNHVLYTQIDILETFFIFYFLYICICHALKYFVYILVLLNRLFKLFKWIYIEDPPASSKDAFGCNNRTRRDGTIPQIRLFGSRSRVGTKLSQCCPQLSLKIGGTREDDRGRPCADCPATKRTLNLDDVVGGSRGRILLYNLE